MKYRLLLFQFLQSCSNERSLSSLHAFLLKCGLSHDSLFATKLTALYAMHASLCHAHQLFDETPHRTTFLYNAILRAYQRAERSDDTLALFRHMCSFSTERPDRYTISIAVKACAQQSEVKAGKAVHAFVKKNAMIDSDKFVGTAFMEFYAKCGEMEGARQVFDEFPQPDVVMWTSMVTWYLQNGDAAQALFFFHEMVMTQELLPDRVTLVSVISACAQSEHFSYGMCCHGFAVRRGIDSDQSVVNALLNFYTKIGSVHYTERLFKSMPVRDIISWSSMIACHVQNEKPLEALAVYDAMVEKGFQPNSVTAICALQACAAASDLARGRKIHELAMQNGFELDIAVSTALIDMYMKCSCLENALGIFNKMPYKDVVVWVALISGYAQNGLANDSLVVFHSMLEANISPDAVTIVKVLAASSQLGILQQASCLHGYLVSSGFADKIFVGAALIDLYSKSGSLDNAIKTFEDMQHKDVVVWSAIIAAYGFHGLGLEAIESFNRMIESSFQPNHVTFVSILSACSHAGLIEAGIDMFHRMGDVYRVAPNSEHYAIMVDLLCRKGNLDDALELINQMPVAADHNVWGALLGGCRIHHHVRIGEIAARNLFKLDPTHAGYYILLANIYADDARWQKASEIRRTVRKKGLRRIPALSSITVGNIVSTFKVDDKSHPESKRIYELVKELEGKMREEGYELKLLDNRIEEML